MMIKMLGDHQLKHRVAQKFQTLIIKMVLLRLVRQTRVRQRFRQQKRIAKLITDPFFEWAHVPQILPDRENLSILNSASGH